MRRLHGRNKVICFTKDNIMKLTDGQFHKVFDEVAAEYPLIESEHWIVNIGATNLADTPETFDVLVMPNLYGGVLSDVAAQIVGSVGLAPSANIGAGAMFEATHGSAPRRADRDLTKPSGLLLAGDIMLVHVGQAQAAEKVHNAWLKTIEDGIHTYDVFAQGVSRRNVGTAAFAQAIVDRLGEQPATLTPARYAASSGVFKMQSAAVRRAPPNCQNLHVPTLAYANMQPNYALGGGSLPSNASEAALCAFLTNSGTIARTSKAITVERTAVDSIPKPAAIPIPAAAQILAAVVNPWTRCMVVPMIIAPAPRNPTP